MCVCVSVPQGTEGSLRAAQTEFRLGLGRAGPPGATRGHSCRGSLHPHHLVPGRTQAVSRTLGPGDAE